MILDELGSSLLRQEMAGSGNVAVKDHNTLGCLLLSNTVVLSLSLVLPPPRCRLSVLSSEHRLNHSTEAGSPSPVLPCTTHARSLPGTPPPPSLPLARQAAARAHAVQPGKLPRPPDRPSTMRGGRTGLPRNGPRSRCPPPRCACTSARLRPSMGDRNTTYVCTSVCRDFHRVIYVYQYVRREKRNGNSVRSGFWFDVLPPT